MENRDYELGARIKAAMNAAGYKAARAFSTENGIPYLTLAQHLQGRRHPTDEYLKLYSKKFGVTMEWLSTGEGDPLIHKKANHKVKLENAVETELDKHRIDIDSGIDVMLLTVILEEIDNLRKKHKLTHRKCAIISAKLYSQVFKATQEKGLQKKMVLAFMKTYESTL